ncbi:type 4a pilus biogenesis protein PilO [Candidatus Poribacteria bacterium]|nr:type 4a pilus biogenesis protein PilO [Candidatus Poribacteria bacterium]
MISEGLKKVLIWSGAWGIIFIGFYLFFWRPHIVSLKEFQSQVERNQKQAYQLGKDIEAYPKTITEENLQKVEENLRYVFTKIPTKEEIPAILNQIRAYSSQNADLDITRISNVTQVQRRANPTADLDNFTPKMTYQITADGNSPDIIRFLYELESGERLITIESFALHRSSGNHTDSENSRRVSMEVTLNIFYSDLEVEEAFDIGILDETN